MTHPAAIIEPDDFEPDETFYSMIAVKHKLYVVGPNHGQLVEVTREGAIRQVIDVSASQGHIAPTAVIFHAGEFQLGNLGTFGSAPGTSMVLDISRSGRILNSADGFTAIVGLSYRHNQLYALQLTTPLTSLLTGETAGMGKVVRLDPSGSVEDVVTGLTLPSAMTFGPDGDLFISNFGTGSPPGSGQIVRVGSETFEQREKDANR
jgi:hypothetical protein